MSQFKDFRDAVNKRFDEMSSKSQMLFTTDVEKDALWDKYLDSFPAGSNNLFRTNHEYDCTCCKQFIRPYANVVAIIDGKIESIWDVTVEGYYQDVADALSLMVKSRPIKDVFVSKLAKLGTPSNKEINELGVTRTWNHFSVLLDKKFLYKGSDSEEAVMGTYRDTKNVLKRALDEISIEAIETVLELIDQKSIYRGEEHRQNVNNFLKLKQVYNNIQNADEKDNYCWTLCSNPAGRIRNTSIGTLLVDIANDRDLDEAVKAFDKIMAPENYKRPAAIFTEKQKLSAQARLEEMGMTNSLFRRYAMLGDITVNNVLFVDRSIKPLLANSPFDSLSSNSGVDPKKFNKVEEVSMDAFLENILPSAKSIEVLLDNKHASNMFSLIAPVYPESPIMFKWNNNFSWVYNGDLTDSTTKKLVEKAGGKVDGALRFSIRWNDEGDNRNDFDAHCVEPNGDHIYFSTYKKPYKSGTDGQLDVDIINPGAEVAVENITWPSLNKLESGKYRFYVKNYSSSRSKRGFSAEIEYGGEIYSFEYKGVLNSSEEVTVAVIELDSLKNMKIVSSLESTVSSRNIWGLDTNNFHKVSMVLNSPNHWDGNKTGNKHVFFALDKCINTEQPRGFFNEFLKDELLAEKRVFEALGSKMRVAHSDEQISGVGISSTQNNDIVVKVTGASTRVIKISNK